MAKPSPYLINLDQTILDRFDQLEQSSDANHGQTGFENLETQSQKTTYSLTQVSVVDIPARATLPEFKLGSPGGLPPSPTGTFSEPNADISQTSIHRIECQSGEIWLSGTSLLCKCPDCAAPMTIRIWLRLADCWRCRTSISLSEEQYQAARELEQKIQPQRPVPRHRPLPAPLPTPRRENIPPRIPEPVHPREQEYEELSRGSLVAKLIRNGFTLTPAWMVSFLLHLIVILILALIVLGDKSFLPETITLSTFLSPDRQEGGEIRINNPLDSLQDDLLIAGDMKLGDREIRDVLRKANQDARQLQFDPNPTAPLRDLNEIKKNITTRPDSLMSFAARDPRVRAEMIRKEGGTTVTEAAVARGLRWLVSVQNDDGGWSLNRYDQHRNPGNKSDIMGTSLALLPLLGAGQTHEYGIYKQSVAAGLTWMIKNQKANGDLRAGFSGQAGMYAHGQGAIVLCEALALTGDQAFQEPAQLAIRFIEFAQHSQGGWRYKPGDAGDTSVFGWQMMALQSANAPNTNIVVDESTLKLADYFLDRVTAPASYKSRPDRTLPKGATYCYQKGKSATPAMTAEAILCRIYLGWKKDDPRLSTSIKWLINDHLPNAKDRNLYYWYYGTQVMHHYGGQPWQIWNDRMRPLLISTQKTRGSNAGSWEPKQFDWGNQGGRIYTTSLAVCTLEVYYRHLPLFKQIDLD